MIRSFRGKFAEAILAQRRAPKGFPADLLKVTRRKLVQLNSAEALDDLAARAICAENIRSASTTSGESSSKWTDAGPEDVEIIDYH